jgi:hypothetical protein
MLSKSKFSRQRVNCRLAHETIELLRAVVALNNGFSPAVFEEALTHGLLAKRDEILARKKRIAQHPK